MMPSEKFMNTVETKSLPIIGNSPKEKQANQFPTKIIVLNNQQYLDSTLNYLEKGWTLEFQIGSSLFGKDIKLFTNYPKPGTDFDRNNYQELIWGKTCKNECKNDFSREIALTASIFLCRAGSFHYYFTDSLRNETIGSGYFIVNPILAFSNDDILPLNSITVQTVLAKSLGKFENWKNVLKVSKNSGYNMVHFTPIQELGGSNSSYCIKDQLNLNCAFNSDNYCPGYEDIMKLTSEMRKEWRVLSLSDIVLNHTANETPWLQVHPECTYNAITAPYLIPAAILDGHLHVLTKEISSGKHENIGIPSEIYSHDHLEAVKKYLTKNLIPQLRLHEFYTADVKKLSDEFLEKARAQIPTLETCSRTELKLINNFNGRNKATVNFDLALKIFNIIRNDANDEETRLAENVSDFKKRILDLNSEIKNEIGIHLSAAIENCIANMRYFRIQEDGPKIKSVSVENPLVPRYFTGKFENYDSVENEVLKNGQYVMAHNGWVMNSDPLKNFAEAGSNVYLRRELIAWGDSVKLRYGKSYQDCPFLWDHMQKYVEKTAEIFDGIRLDNCHSTPLHVAEYLLDCARKINPDLYVVAELFTNSDVTDNIFANRLGITSMIRESLNAYDSFELGRLIYRFGGKPVGSFCERKKSTLLPSVSHALFYDVTHDNPSLITKRSVFDSLSTAALVSISCCAIGSTRGFDELVPHHINVVSEKRLYPSWTDDPITNNASVNLSTGFISVRKALNKIHKELSENGFNQVFVDQMNDDVIAVTRHNPVTHENVILVSYTAFHHINPTIKVNNLKIEGEVIEIILEAKILSKDDTFPTEFKPNDTYINGLSNYQVLLEQNLKIAESKMIKLVKCENESKISEIEFENYVPGSIIIFRVRPRENIRSALQRLDEKMKSFINFEFDSEIFSAVSKLNLNDLNHALYRCSEEDLEDGTGSYFIPEYGQLVYCGLQGFESVLRDVVVKNDLGHPLCNNLRQGDWMLDYVIGRLKTCKATVELALILEKVFENLRQIPKYLIPSYFELIITSICYLLKSRAAYQMSEFVKNGSTFIRFLALGSVQCVGVVDSSSLPPFSANMVASDDGKRKITMSAGLPHFSTGYMRSWGRDTFISLRGLLLLTGRFEDAKYHILGYASCLRHGLIPNLLDQGVNARYNCRDAVWWWLYSIISYIDLVPNGHEILKEMVSRIFPNDDSPPLGPGLVNQPLFDIMQEALNVHFKKLTFRERNAGPAIDAHMTNEGFNNEIGVDMNTGFVYGGNEFNCGTWMDKMGSDPKTGNKGKPATPRNGSAVELVGLCKAVVSRLHILNEKGVYPYSGVEKLNEKGEVQKWSFKDWEEKILENFEKMFWIPEKPSPSETKPELIHRRQIYKDSVGASPPWSDYQLRPNFLIALTVAPEIVDPKNAWIAIKKVENILLGPLGIKTLDPADWNYNGFYNNDDHSDNIKTAQGFNYHQGPEWLWPVGYFLRAKILFARKLGTEESLKSISEIKTYLGNHYQEICESPWRGLPELTNVDGQFCQNSCRVQAWSMACILEVLHDIYLIEKENENNSFV